MCWSHHKKKNAQVELRRKYVGQTLLRCQRTENSISVRNSQSDLLPSGVEGSMCCRGMQQMHRFFGSPFSPRSVPMTHFQTEQGTRRFTGDFHRQSYQFCLLWSACNLPHSYPSSISASCSVYPPHTPSHLSHFHRISSASPANCFLHVPFIFFWSCQFSHFPHSPER